MRLERHQPDGHWRQRLILKVTPDELVRLIFHLVVQQQPGGLTTYAVPQCVSEFELEDGHYFSVCAVEGEHE